MKQIAKWTLLCLFSIAVGFGATFVVAHRTELAQNLMARLALGPAPASPAVEVLPALPELADETLAVDATVGTAAAAAAASEAAVAEADLLQQAQVSPAGALTAVGVVELTKPRQVVLGTGGEVQEVNVEVGDAVTAGMVLVTLDTTQLDWSLEQAEIGFETARIDFEDVGEIEASDVAVAEANLLLAQENLAVVEAGPTEEEIAAAESSAASAWARLQELEEQPTPAQINQALASLRKAEIAVQAAQREYDKIAWLPEAAATSAADTLQQATVDLEAARAAYEEANQPADESAIQGAVASAQSAQDALNELRKKPTAAELADARATVASAEAALEIATRGAKEGDLRKAELGVRQALIALEQARLDRQYAEVLAPIDGTILSVNVELGQMASAGTVVATMANTADVKLVINVEQKDISRVAVGQPVAIAIYALPNETFFGVVEKIAPVADAGTGFVTFPVIIRMTEGPLAQILPGMTASAGFNVEAPEPTATEEAATEEAEVTPTPEAEATPAAEEAPTEEAPEEAATPTAEPEPSPTASR